MEGPRNVAAALRQAGHEGRAKAHGIKAGMKSGVKSFADRCDNLMDGFCSTRHSRERSWDGPMPEERKPMRRASTTSSRASTCSTKTSTTNATAGPKPDKQASDDLAKTLEAAPLQEDVSAEKESLAEARADFLRGQCVSDMQVQKVKSDGNCQFRAIAVQIYGSEDWHSEVRQGIVRHIEDSKELYMEFMDEPYDKYIASMAKPGTWGDHITLQAASDWSGRQIIVLAEDPAAGVTLLPRSAKDELPPVYLAYISGVHYDAVIVP